MAKKILIVDDSVTMTLSLKSGLELNGFIIETASDGMLALNKLKAGFKPDLIITDINMPNMDGLELIRQIKVQAHLKFTPILTLTTEGDPSKREIGKKLGATGWLIKPISGLDLLKVIKQVLPGS